MVILLKRGNMKKNILIFVFTLVILIIGFVYDFNEYVYVAIIIATVIFIYTTLTYYVNEKKDSKYIREQLKIAKMNVFDVDNVILMIIKENKIVWANDLAYQEFPNLYESRSRDFLLENEDGNILKYNNKAYQILEKGSIYFLINITKEYREQNKLRNIQTIIGMLRIDNLKALEQSMGNVEYLEFNSEFKQELFRIFIENKIYFEEVDEDQFFLNIPYHFIETGLEDRFKVIGDLIKSFHDEQKLVTVSVGIAYNFSSVLETGERAKEALDLAISRGGAQIVIFDDKEKKYFGGGISEVHDSTRLRARIIGTTLLRVVDQRDVIYLMTHKNPDPDAMASQLLMYKFLKNTKNDVKIVVDGEDAIERYNLRDYDFRDDIITSYVVDNTKKNTLIVLDTQSSDIVSHPKLIKQINDLIVIDHHQTPKNYFRGNLFSWIEPGASSTVELVMSILEMTNNQISNTRINNLSIEGVLTDTDMLKYRVGSQTLAALMNLVDWGGRFGEVLEESYPEAKTFLEKQKILVDTKFYNRFSVVEEEREVDEILMSMVVDTMLEVKGKVGAIIFSKVDDDYYRVKIRTNGEINAKILIEEYNGGGHITQAAGYVSSAEKTEILERLSEL